MTNEEAKVFLDNLKICIEEHPVVADWLVEIADRKTENCSEKPNNCEEPQTENLFTDKYGDVWEWRGDAWYCISGQDEPQTDCSWK